MDQIDEIISKISEMRKQQEEAQAVLYRLTGQLESETSRLLEDFKVKSLKDADAHVEKLQKRLAKIDDQIVQKFEKLKSEYPNASS